MLQEYSPYYLILVSVWLDLLYPSETLRFVPVRPGRGLRSAPVRPRTEVIFYCSIMKMRNRIVVLLFHS